MSYVDTLDTVDELRTYARQLENDKAAAADNLQAVGTLWQAAQKQFGGLKKALENERFAHNQTKERLTTNQNRLQALTKAASQALEEYNELKIKYDSVASHSGPATASSPQASNSQLSNIYLIPTLTSLGGQLESAEMDMQRSEQRAREAEAQVERLTAAASAALDEFQQLKKLHAVETVKRQEAEKLAAELSAKLESGGGGGSGEISTSGNSSEEVRKERKLRELAEKESKELSTQLARYHGMRFDLMTVTELECKLEDANRALQASEQRYEDVASRLEKAQTELTDCQNRLGSESSGAPPPPAPPPPVFNVISPSEGLKSRLQNLKSKLQNPSQQADPLNDLRQQAMEELAAKLKKRNQQSKSSGGGGGSGGSAGAPAPATATSPVAVRPSTQSMEALQSALQQGPKPAKPTTTTTTTTTTTPTTTSAPASTTSATATATVAKSAPKAEPKVEPAPIVATPVIAQPAVAAAPAPADTLSFTWADGTDPFADLEKQFADIFKNN